MFIQKIKDEFFWKHQFNEIWVRCFGFESSSRAHGFFNYEELEKQKYLWREKKGQQYGYSPRKAAYNAFKELADKWYRNKGYKDENELLEVAHILESLFPSIDENGHYQDAKQFLDEPWKGFAQKFWEDWKAARAEEDKFVNELQSYRFDMQEVDKSWEALRSENIPVVASEIWKASYPRKWAKDIISETNVTTKEFCFWMCVFRKHLGYTEEVVLGKHMYLASKKSLSDEINCRTNYHFHGDDKGVRTDQ